MKNLLLVFLFVFSFSLANAAVNFTLQTEKKVVVDLVKDLSLSTDVMVEASNTNINLFIKENWPFILQKKETLFNFSLITSNTRIQIVQKNYLKYNYSYVIEKKTLINVLPRIHV